MASTHRQAQKRKFWGRFRIQKMGENVGLHVVDRDHRESMCPSPRFGKSRPNVQTPHQSRTSCVRHCIDICHLNSGRLHGGLQRRNHVLRVGSARQFRDHTAVLLMHGLVRNGIGQYLAAADHRHSCIVTGRFNGKDNGRSWHDF